MNKTSHGIAYIGEHGTLALDRSGWEVMEEPKSDKKAKVERRKQSDNGLDKHMENFVSHRVATVKSCDQIIVLEEGKIVELGTHDSLLANDGFYRHLYESQLMEDEIKVSKL